jgi:hypothetical protein
MLAALPKRGAISMDILYFAVFLLPGLLVGITGIRYLARSLVFTIPFTRKLDIRGIHLHPDKTRIKTCSIMAAILVVDILVCIVFGSYFSIVAVIGFAFGQILPLAFSSNVFVADAGNIDRYVAANRAYLDPDAFAAYLAEDILDPMLVAKHDTGEAYSNMIRSMMRAKSFEEQVEGHGPGMTISR